MGIERIVTVTISRQTRGVTQAGFGIPLILGPNADFSGVRTYRSLPAVLADFATNEAEYLAAQKIFSQTPKPASLKIKKTSTPVAQVSTVSIVTVTNSSSYSVEINGVIYTFLSDADATGAEIQAGLIAAINGGTEPVTASAGAGTAVTLTADNAGEGFSVAVGDVKLSYVDTTPNVGVASDILAAMQEDSTWYALVLTTVSDTAVKEAAKTIEALRRLFIFRSNAAGVKQSGNSDIASFMKAKGYSRTGVIYHSVANDFADAAWFGRVLPLNPGSETWAFKELSGVTVDALTDSEINFIEGKNASYYDEVAGVKITEGGKVASGEYIDIIRGIDKLQARIEERIFGLLAKVDKVPFTDAGIAQVESELIGALKGSQTDGLILSYETFVPKAAAVSTNDKAERLLPDVEFTAILQGAVHKVQVNGVVSL